MRTFLVTMILPLTFAVSANANDNTQPKFERSIASDIEQFDAKQSWSQQIFERELDALGEFFIQNKNLADNAKAGFLMKSDVRQSLFRLQALSRMLSDQSPKFFDKQRKYFKKLEDVVGKLDLAMSLHKTGDGLKVKKLSEKFEKQEKEAREDMIEAMKESGLWEEPEATLADLREDFAKKGKWVTGHAEKTALLRIIAGYTLDLSDAVKANKFDDADIEKGLHELRRRLRWIGMQVTTLSGVVQLTDETSLDGKLKNLIKDAQAKNPKMMASKYMKVGDVLVENPIQVPRQTLAMITEYVSRIGASKDNAEMQIYIDEAMKDDQSSDKAGVDKKLQDLLKSDKVDHQAMSRAIQAEITASKLLRVFVEQLAEMN